MASAYIAKRDYGKRGSELNKKVIPFGRRKVTLYRRGDVIQSSWYFRVHIKEEDRSYRQSLHTVDRNEAEKAVHEEMIRILTRVGSGERLLALALKDLVRKFSLHMESVVAKNNIASSTWRNQRYRIGLGVEFLKTRYPRGTETKITEIDGEKFRDYLEWRLTENKAKGRSLRKDVVRDELLVIRKMFTFAKEQRLCTERSLPNWDFKTETEGPKRKRITPKNFYDFFRVGYEWVKEAKAEKNEQTFYHRFLTLSVAAFMWRSGMRSGEVFGLKNKDLEIKADEVVITIRKETSKIRRGRVIAIHSDFFNTWLKRQKHKAPNDYVFSPLKGGKTSARDTVYHQFKSLRERLKIIDLEEFDLYHCRHWWITERIMAKEQLIEIAKAAGTSVSEIESTYAHLLTEQTTRKFNETKFDWQQGGSFEVIRKQIDSLSN